MIALWEEVLGIFFLPPYQCHLITIVRQGAANPLHALIEAQVGCDGKHKAHQERGEDGEMAL